MNSITTSYTKASPFLARVKARYPLNKSDSTKKTYHITLDISGSGMVYEPGDSIGVLPSNPPELVDDIIKHAKLPALRDHLTKRVNLSRVTTPFLEAIGISFDDPKKKAAHLASTDLLDNIKAASTITEEAFSHLPPLLPRFYSIASSQKVVGESIDLVVATFTYTHNGHERSGIGSRFLCEADEIPIFLHPSTFRPVSTPMILIGPGTGVAPYRAFLQEHPGTHWLFFGERNRASDFYYEDFFTTLPDLRISTAFSRDQDRKIYVQDRMLEEGTDLWQWIDNGATIYICGDARHMAKDVTAALHTIAEQHGKVDGKAFIKVLRKEKRLRLDVY